VVARQSDTAAAQAVVASAKRTRCRAAAVCAHRDAYPNGRWQSLQEFDDDRASMHGAEAAVTAAQAQVAAAQAAIKAAQAQVVGANSGVTASKATIARIEADIQDSQLKSPRDGRVQYRVAQPGEVLAPAARFSTWLISTMFI
jgi:HlyD family secretion protein